MQKGFKQILCGRLCGGVQSRIIAPPFFGRRHSADCRTDTPIISIAHKITPNKRFQLLYRVIFRLASSKIKQLVFHSRPHTFAAGVIVASSAGAVHTLTYFKLLNRCTVFFACVLNAPVGMDYRRAHFLITPACVFKSQDAQFGFHIIVRCKSQNR